MDPLLSRYRITTHPQALPGQCALTGKSDDEWYIDTGLDIPFHGAIYIGASAFKEIAGLLGYADPDVVNSLKMGIDQLQTDKAETLIKIDGLERAVNGLVAAGYPSDVARSHLVGDTVLEGVELSEQSDESDDVELFRGTESMGDGETESVEPNSSEQSGQLRSASSDSDGTKSILGI